ncbi:MAG TPA: hypothetical protein VJY54_03505 [Lachnospiraceae bacterium]|nr:hypothetical protein [Lachnospiraceae bacterium]
MTFKKNLLSYFLWGSYAFLACTGLIGVLFYGLNHTPLNSIYAKISIVCLAFVLAAGISTLIRHVKNHNLKKNTLVLVEAFAAVILVGIGILLRVYFMNGGREEAAYYEIAKVTGEAIKPVAHGVQYFYLILLRWVFLITGNFFTVGIILQICLQCLATLIWYFVIRKYAGSLASVIFLSIIMLLPENIKAAITYSPKMLYLLLLGIALSFIAKITEINQRNGSLKWDFWIKLIFTGCLMGAFTYLDVTGLILGIPVIFICFLEKNQNVDEKKKKILSSVLQCVIILISFLVFLFGSFFIDSYMNHVSLLKVIQVWTTLFRYKGVVSIHTMETTILAMNDLRMIAIISFLIVLGVPGFFAKKKTNIQMLWFVMAFVTVIMWTCNFHYTGMTCEQLLLFTISALTGVGIQAIFGKSDSVQKAVLPNETIPDKEKEEGEGEGQNNIQIQHVEKQIHYIDNPLPLPKKHVKKVLDYHKEIPMDQMKYDIEVTEKDDFDR